MSEKSEKNQQFQFFGLECNFFKWDGKLSFLSIEFGKKVSHATNSNMYSFPFFLANATSISNDNNSSTNAEDILDTYSHDDASVDLVPVLEPTGM